MLNSLFLTPLMFGRIKYDHSWPWRILRIIRNFRKSQKIHENSQFFKNFITRGFIVAIIIDHYWPLLTGIGHIDRCWPYWPVLAILTVLAMAILAMAILAKAILYPVPLYPCTWCTRTPLPGATPPPHYPGTPPTPRSAVSWPITACPCSERPWWVHQASFGLNTITHVRDQKHTFWQIPNRQNPNWQNCILRPCVLLEGVTVFDVFEHFSQLFGTFRHFSVFCTLFTKIQPPSSQAGVPDH